MDKFDNASMYFETKSTATKKLFKISFPLDVLFSLEWDKKDLKRLRELDKSETISGQLEMLTMIAKKVEARAALQEKEVKEPNE